jgi:glucokinase
MRGAIVGVDVGGTNVKMGVFSVNGELLEKWEIPTCLENNGEYVLRDICKEIDEHVDKNQLIGVGIGIPGPVSPEGDVLGCVNLGWGTFNLEGKLSEMLGGIKVKAGNDATLAALGEKWKGSGKTFENVVFVTLGTGVGGGVIVYGRLVFGSNGAAGEIGHMPVAIDLDLEASCTCGKKGCLDQVSSATAIVQAAEDFATAKDVFDAAKNGNEKALAAVDRAAKYLGIALASISSVTNPKLIIIGGGVSKQEIFC